MTEAQSADLTTRISPVVPKLAPDEIGQRSRYVCSAILAGGSDKALVATAVKHFGLEDDPLTDEEAAGVVASVRAAGFCPQDS